MSMSKDLNKDRALTALLESNTLTEAAEKAGIEQHAEANAARYQKAKEIMRDE